MDRSHEGTRREPLWEPKPAEGRSKGRALAVCIAMAALLSAPLAFEREFLSSSQGEAAVTIIGVQDDRPQGRRTPAAFRYRVSLRDGSRALFVSDRVQQPGSELIVTVSRGRLTGRLWLTDPYRPAGTPAVSPSVP